MYRVFFANIFISVFLFLFDLICKETELLMRERKTAAKKISNLNISTVDLFREEQVFYEVSKYNLISIFL